MQLNVALIRKLHGSVLFDVIHMINMNRGSSYLDHSVVVINRNFQLWLFYFKKIHLLIMAY